MAFLTRREALLRTMGAAAGMVSLPRGAALAAPVHEPIRHEDIDRALRAKVEAGEIPGVVAVAGSGKAVLYQGAFGYRHIGDGARMSTDTVFRIASILTSVAALQLVEQGKLKLDEPAASIDPSLATLEVLTGFDANGAPELRSAHQPVTLRQLLSHTAGFSYPLWDETVVHYLKVAHQHRSLPRRPLVFDPGSRWAYGSSLDYVGRMVEIASAKNLDSYFRDHITGPLGMDDTGFSLNEKQRAREANLHVRQASGRLKPEPLEKPVPQTSHSGGGGIYSTAPDYLKLLQALLNGGSLGDVEILRPKTVALMGENQIGNLEAGRMKTTNPALSNDVDFFPGKRLRWGLGHMINLDPVTDGRKAGSLTWAGLFNTYYWMDPGTGLAGVIMMQILPFADAHALSAYRRFERGLYHAVRQA